MANVGDVQVCTEIDSGGDCIATVWMPPPSFLPPMSHSDAAPIIAAIVGLWVLAFVWVRARAMVNAGAG